MFRKQQLQLYVLQKALSMDLGFIIAYLPKRFVLWELHNKDVVQYVENNDLFL